MTTAAPDADPARTPGTLLRRAVTTRPGALIAASVLYCGHQLGEAMVPVIVGATLSGVIGDAGTAHVIAWLVLLAADFVLLSLSYRFGARASARAKQLAGHGLRLRLTGRALAPAGGADRAPGDLLTRAAADADRVGAFAGIIAQTVAAAVAMLVAVCLLLRLSLPLGLATLVGAPLLLLASGVASRRNVALSHTEQEAAGRATVAAEDLLRGIRVVKGIGAEDATLARYRLLNRAGIAASQRLAIAEASVDGANALLAGVYLAVVTAVGGGQALLGGLGLGPLVSSLGLCLFVIGPMRVLAGFAPGLARARASAARVHEVLMAPPAVAERADAAHERAFPRAPTLELIDLELAPRWTVSLTLGPGMTGVVHPDATVVARLVDMLGRQSEPAAGSVRLDGVDLRELPLDLVRRTALVGAHEQPVFAGTVLENAGLIAAPGTRATTIAAALNAAHAVDLTPDDAGSQLGDGGARLSGGQRQRLALARLIAADAPVLVLENPTTAVDAVTEGLIATRLREVRRGRTTIIFTSSPALLAACDRVLLLERPLLDGTHDELLATDRYRLAVAR